MLIEKKLGNISDMALLARELDVLEIAWFESGKRIMHKTTVAGRNIITKFLKENQQLTDGDILFEDDMLVIVVSILPCDVLVIRPRDQQEIAAVCYEIGNRHIPLFFSNGELLIAFERPLYSLLQFEGYEVEQAVRKLVQPLKTSVQPHATLASEHLFNAVINDQPVT